MNDQSEVTFFVNDEALVVHTHALTVREILDAGLQHNRVLYEQRDGTEHVYDQLEQPIPLREGTRLRTRPHEYHIVVNGRAREVDHAVLTYDEVVALAPNMPPPSDTVELLVTNRNGADHAKGDLLPGETVAVKDGTEFSVAPGNRS